MTFTTAANELDAVRNDRHTAPAVLLPRVDAVGAWAASQKHTARIGRLLSEASLLADRLQGGTGKGGNRLDLV